MPAEVMVKKRYPDFFLDLAFKTDSKKTGILGASGSGKSLTLKSVAGLVRPDDGRIKFDGRVLFDRKKRIDIRPQKRGVGYLFQDYALFPEMTVAENIGTALYGRKKAGRGEGGSVDEILERFEISHVKDRRPTALSGGEKQRCALARMMASGPDLLLLDEPFSAMDMHLREGLRLKLKKVLEEYDRSFILVSHDRDEIYQMCDHLVLMQEGRVIAEGSTEAVFADPGTVAAARLTGCKNISRIERTGDHRVKALDWGGIELITEKDAGEDVTHIGIRAHDLFAGRAPVNVISCGKVSVSRLPFEWYVTLENGLWWKAAKELSEGNSQFVQPESLSVLPEKILLLKQ